MTDVREATDALLADRPELESDLRSLLVIDEDPGPSRKSHWTPVSSVR